MIIGNGEETRVWQDQWIVQKPARKVQVVRRDLEGVNIEDLQDMRVSELLVSQGKSGTEEL